MKLREAIKNKPEGGYGVILADVPWTFKTHSQKGLEGRPQHYERMTLTDIKALPVHELAAKDCFLFFWTSGPYLKQAFSVIDDWGFKYSSIGFQWLKLRKGQLGEPWNEGSFCMGQGYTTRSNGEICLLAKRGKPRRLSASVREFLPAERREHSRKPDESISRIEQFASGPYIELFARNQREGWTTWGNETDRFEVAA